MMKVLIAILAILFIGCLVISVEAQTAVEFDDIAWQLDQGRVYDHNLNEIGFYTSQKLEQQGRGFQSGRIQIYLIATIYGDYITMAVENKSPTRDELQPVAAIGLAWSQRFVLNNQLILAVRDRIYLFGTLVRL